MHIEMDPFAMNWHYNSGPSWKKPILNPYWARRARGPGGYKSRAFVVSSFNALLQFFFSPTPSHIRLNKMLSFRSIIFAAAAFASIASAIPTAPLSNDVRGIGDIVRRDQARRSVSGESNANVDTAKVHVDTLKRRQIDTAEADIEDDLKALSNIIDSVTPLTSRIGQQQQN